MKKRARFHGLLVLLAVFGPMLAAYGIYHTGFLMPSGTVNQGELVEPARPVVELGLRTLDDSALNLQEQDKKWRYLLVGDAVCADLCREHLYLTRQVHIRLGEKARRVERFYLTTAGNLSPELAEYIETEHPRLQVVTTSKDQVSALLENTSTPFTNDSSQYFLIDQDGFLMMAYSNEHDGNQLLKDIKKLLKYTYEES